MYQNQILIVGLIALILCAGCTSNPGTITAPQASATQPGSAATKPVPSPQGTTATIAGTGNTVSVFYTGTLDNGTVFDSNVNSTPLTFTIGQGMVIPGFEDAVIGMRINESKTVTIPAAEAYGSYEPSLVYTVNRSPTNDMVPVVGQYITVRSSDGATGRALIVNVTNTTFTYDVNSPLAGQNLTFGIRLAGIQ